MKVFPLVWSVNKLADPEVSTQSGDLLIVQGHRLLLARSEIRREKEVIEINRINLRTRPSQPYLVHEIPRDIPDAAQFYEDFYLIGEIHLEGFATNGDRAAMIVAEAKAHRLSLIRHETTTQTLTGVAYRVLG